MRKYSYNKMKYDFRSQVQEVFPDKLEELHQDMAIVNAYTDQDSLLHKMYYHHINKTEFYSWYNDFIFRVIEPLFNEPILYQRIPTFRVHMKGNLGVGEFHKDSQYAHSRDEINVFLPFTKAYGNNTIWVESEEDKGDYAPMEANYGEFYIWSGATLTHGNKLNDTDQTRVSVDFRILPKSKYVENTKETISAGTKMIIGGYWSE